FRWTYDTQATERDGTPSSTDTRAATPSAESSGRIVPCGRRSQPRSSARTADCDYQLSYANKYTMPSKLMHRFHERLVQDTERKALFARIFGGLHNEFAAVPEFARFKALLVETAEDFGQN